MSAKQSYRAASGTWICTARSIVIPPFINATARVAKVRSASTYSIAPPRRTDYLAADFVADASNTGPLVAPPTVIGTPPTFDGSGVCTDMGTSQDFVATFDGQVISGLEVWGRINLGLRSNVVVENNIVHGTLLRGTDTAHVIASGDDLRGAIIRNNKLCGRPVIVPATYTAPGGTNVETLPNPGFVNNANEWCGGIRGGNFTFQGNELVNVSDGLNNIYNALVQGNWIHGAWFNEWPDANGTPSSGAAVANSRFYPYATGTSGKYTHCDGIQFSIKKNVTVRGNYIGGLHVPGAHNASPSEAAQIRTGDDFYNSCILMKQEAISGDATKILQFILIENNTFFGGVSGINWPSDDYAGGTYQTVVFRGNKFPRANWASPMYILENTSGGVIKNGDKTNGVTWTPTIPDPLLVAPGAPGWTGNTFTDTGGAVTITNGY